MKRTLTAIVAALTFTAAAVHAEAPLVTSYVEPDSIFIGDRFTYVIEVEKDMAQNVWFPDFRPDPECGVELAGAPVIDTVSHEGRRIKLRRRYVMAAFEEGRFDLGRASVLYADKNIVDTLYGSDENRVMVATFIIDSSSHEIFDLKPQKRLPFRFGEIRGLVLRLLALLLLLAAAAWGLYRWLRSHGRSVGSLFKSVPVPPHVEAIHALEELHNRKLWQNGRHKEYYSGLSDILRRYLSGRYGVKAMEMTTDEIQDSVRNIDMPAKSLSDLLSVLRSADLAKFAKFEAEAEQNEADYHKAYYFVEETKEVDEPQGGDEAEILDTKLKGGHDA